MNPQASVAEAVSRPTAATIPVVEDDQANRALPSGILGSERYRVILRAGGESGLRGPGGFELTRRLRQDPALATLPILPVTGRTAMGDVVAGLDAGADDFITRPFARPQLIARIRSALRLRRVLVGMEAAHAVVAALANAVEAKDAPTEHHCARLALLANRLRTVPAPAAAGSTGT